MWPANGHVPIEDGSVNMTPEQDSNQSGENVMAGFDSEDDNMEIVEEQSYSNFGIYNANKLSSPLAQKLDLTASPNRYEDSTKQKIERLAQLFKELSQAEQREVFTRLLEETSMTNIRHLRHLIEPHFQRDFLSFLPVEIGMKIIAKLNGIDKIKLSSVSKNWRLISEHHSIWKNTYDEELFNLPDPTNRISGAWQQATKCNGPNISDYWSNYQSNKKGSIYARAPEKAKYMRMERISQNWKENPIRASCILRGHEDHVITCMQIHDDLLVTGSDDNTLKVWSIDKGALKFSLTGHTGGVWTSQISSCGQYIISGSTDRTVKVWSTIDGSLKHTLQGHTSTVRCMAMWNNLLVTGSRDTTLRIWNINEGRCLLILLGHQAAVRCVQFDGKLVVSGGYDFTVKIWSASSGRCLKTLAGHTNRVYSLLFDRDRSIVASGSLDTTIRVWDFQKRDGEECIALLQGHTSLTSGMQLKGNILVSCNADSHVRVWDIRDGSCVFYLTGHRSAITSLQFFGNHIIATSSDDGTVKLWDIKKGSFLRDLVSLESGGSGGCIWRLCATPTLLACAVGSRNSTEETKVILLNFDSVYP